MQYSSSIKNNYEFRRLYAKGKSASTPLVAAYCRKNRSQGNKLGITVSTKVGNAVVRNKVRRRLKEIYRLNELSVARGYDIVLVARVKSRYCSYRALEADVLKLLEKLGIKTEARAI